jgi:FixJ family two-component response regulator
MDSRKSVVAIVDDDPRLLESLADLLESAGHEVRSFPAAKLLLEHHHLSEIDCLITDIGMAEIDGFELQRLAKAARPELPVILITGRHEIADQQRALAQGEHRFFRKPFDGQALLAAISQALDAGTKGTERDERPGTT